MSNNMAIVWKFKEFTFEPASSRIIPHAGKAFSIRGKKLRALLLALIDSYDAPSNEELIERIWGSGTSTTAHDLANLIYEFRGCAPEFKELIQTGPLGYILSERPVKAGDSLYIFPGVSTPAGALFIYSSVDYGEHDHVDRVEKKVIWEARTRHMVPASEEMPETMAIRFRHTPSTYVDDKSWWVVVVPTRIDPVTGDWATIDLNDYKALQFEARSRPAFDFAERRTLPLMVRLEDDSEAARGGSGRQSTNWYPRALDVPEHFLTFELPLRRFDWSQKAFSWNTEAVAIAKIAQIVFGHDSSVPRVEGMIEIRNIRFAR